MEMEVVINSSRMATYLRKSAKRFLTHTCTLNPINRNEVPVTEDSNDEWDNQLYVDETPVTELPCLFLWEDVQKNEPSGVIIVKTPTLYVLQDDDVLAGDSVSNVLARDGSTVLLSSALIESIDATAEVGNPALKVLRLTGATT